VKKLLVALGIAALSTGAMAQSWEFEKTVGIGIGAAFTDPNGNYYYRSADASVTKADYNGNILSVWGAGILSGGGQGTFGRDGNIYIKDNNVVRKFDANGNFLMNIGQGQFGGAGSLATNSRGELYVADEYAHKIRVYKTDGTFVREFGSFGTGGQGTFAWPSGITIDKNDRVFIVENAIPYTTERGRPSMPMETFCSSLEKKEVAQVSSNHRTRSQQIPMVGFMLVNTGDNAFRSSTIMATSSTQLGMALEADPDSLA